MKAKKMFIDQPTINQTQQEAIIKTQAEAHVQNTYKNHHQIIEISSQTPIYNHLKTSKKDFKLFIETEE